MLQVVFRKIADVLREKELAERDRLGPPVELSPDHPVRRLISRFRKMSCSRVPSATAGMQLGDLSTSDTLTVDTPLYSLAGRKTHSIDATNCSTADVCNRPSALDTATNNCTVSNGGTAVSSGRAAWRRLLSTASSTDITNAAAAVTASPSNNDNTRVINSNTTGNCEERALLSDNVVLRTPRSKWTSLLSHVHHVPSSTTTTAAVTAVTAAADNEVFDVEEAGDKSLPVKLHVAESVETTIELQTSRRLSVSSDEVVSPVDRETVFGVMDLRSELNRQLSAVHERIDTMSQRLEVVLRLLANTTPQRRSADFPATNLS